MKQLLVTIAAAALTLSTQAQTAREEIAANKYLSGSQYLDYNRRLPDKPLTPAPKGYEPFYLSHYGRHGSRWLLTDGSYSNTIATLKEAKRAGVLTPLGEETLQKLEDFYPTTIKRLGDLSPLGERQHHGIGRRMAQNFPEIFKTKDVQIDARSTVVIRCILSMVAECEELAAANPTARIHNDVSESLQYYLNQNWDGEVKRQGDLGNRDRYDYYAKYVDTRRLMASLFSDQQWVADFVRANSFARKLFEIACNMQSHDTDIELYSLFTDDEIYNYWKANNIGWYLGYGAAPQTGRIMPFGQRNLLRNIIETADTVTRKQATLRFGHEVCVLPLAALLELDDCGVSVENLDTLDQVWQNYKIFPMACNIQLIFYRPKKGNGDTLVKALLNEREARLPIPTDQYPYYRWADLRQYYLDKLSRFDETNK